MKSVKIYTTPTCPFCKAAKEFFKENNVAYEELNVMENEDALRWMQENNYSSVPVIVINGTIINGFGTDEKERVRKELGLGGRKNA